MLDSRPTASFDAPECWPVLRLADWVTTRDTLHMWTQIVGKVRLALTPLTNHWWNVPFYVSTCGLTTSPIPYEQPSFEVEFDFIAHQLHVRTSEGRTKDIPLAPLSVADFYREFMAALKSLDVQVAIWKMPVEVANTIPFDQDRTHASYDRDAVRTFWRILVSVDEVFKRFRSRFIGKSSPVHFFWGAFDLAVTRFSGRRAPERNDADPILHKIMREGYSHEVISAGFWPGGGGVEDAAFYAYAAPQPEGFEKQGVRPAKAFYHTSLGEYVLMYEDVRRASSPTAALLEFLESTYEAGATTGKWDRKALERQPQTATGAA
ncbi:MAG TPA: DUF5996 family protein [Candidatus Angelobacter sp.]|nr:DUF5996 family protein [Candidatus Angelobacter sp.]